MNQYGKDLNGNGRFDYAVSEDFCNVLLQDSKPLYLLAFLLTSNHEVAEQCFQATIEKSFEPSAVFKAYVPSWIRRTIIRIAIERVFSSLSGSERTLDRWYPEHGDAASAINSIIQLSDLDRFVFVMSFLARYSAYECSLLVGCTVRQVIEALDRGLQQLPFASLRNEQAASCYLYSIA